MTATQQKLLALSEEDKRLIYFNQLEVHTPSREETDAFFAVCEEYGLNPLTGDIVFQKRFVKKINKAIASYIVTRDGHHKYAMRNPNFVKMISYVVCEGDHFEIDALAGVPKHTFGIKRGAKLGAWAMIEDKVRGCMTTFVEFEEYYKANQSNHIWGSMPSAMIKKVAQVEVLRMAFPLGIHFRTEFEGDGVIDLNADMKEGSGPVTDTAVTKEKETNAAATNLLFSEEDLTAKRKEVEARQEEAAQVSEKKEKPKRQTAKQKKEQESAAKAKEQQEPVKEEPAAPVVEEIQPVTEAELAEKIQPVKEAEPAEEIQIVKEIEPVKEIHSVEATEANEGRDSSPYLLLGARLRKGQATGQPVLVVMAERNGERVQLIAKEQNIIDQFDQVEDNQNFRADITSAHGFNVVNSIKLA